MIISFNTLCLTGVVLIFTSCASIVSKTNWPLTVDSNPRGASIVITNREGKVVYKGTTPAHMKLFSGTKFFKRQSYQIKFQMPGYEISEVPINCEINGWYWGNILFGGIIGFLFIDPGTGAMYKLETQYISETLIKLESSLYTDCELTILEIKDVPHELMNKLIRIY